MMTLIFGQMLVHKERINERGSLFLSNETVVHKRKNKWKRAIYFGQMFVWK